MSGVLEDIADSLARIAVGLENLAEGSDKAADKKEDKQKAPRKPRTTKAKAKPKDKPARDDKEPSPDDTPAVENEEEDKPAEKITVETVTAELLELVEVQGTQAGRNLVASFGAKKVSEIKPEDYAECVAAIRRLLGGGDGE